MLQPNVSDGVVTWFCDRCSMSIEDRGGYLGVDTSEATRIRELWREHRERHPLGSALSKAPEETRTPWYVLHDECGPDPEPGGEYSIEIGNVRTLSRLLHWTGHLMEKNWISYTNWTAVIRQVAKEG